MSLWTKGDQACVAPNLNVAVAFMTCGVRCHREFLIDDHTGREIEEFHLDASSDPALTQAGPDDPAPLQIGTAAMLKLLRENQLETADPAHPLVDVLQGMNIRECLLSYMERGRRYRITPLVGTGRAVLTEGQEPMAAQVGQPTFRFFRTNDLNLSCALVRCGVPMLDVHGAKPSRLFVHPVLGYALGPEGPVDGLALAKSIQDGTLAQAQPHHPALWVMTGLQNRADYLSHLKHGARFVLIRDPKSRAWVESKRCATVRAGSNSIAFDRALKFIRRK